MTRREVTAGIEPSLFLQLEPFLKDYFGIWYGYFITEIEHMDGYFSVKTPKGESRLLNALNILEGSIPLAMSFSPSEITVFFNETIQEKDDVDDII